MPSRLPPGPADPPDPSAALLPHYHHRPRPILVPVVSAAAALTALAVTATVLAVLLYRRLARGSAAPTAPADLKPPPTSPLRQFAYSQLRRATASFSPSHKLGQGGFGPVFRGALPSGQEIAVKLMDSGSLQGEREFQNELALAGKMLAMGSSPDRGWVVAPLGYCSSDEKRRRRRWRRWRGEDKEEVVVEACAAGAGTGRRLLLVYELMHNGSLQDALLDRRCPELMDWGRRFSVALDIARGLQFLHAVCDPPVIHGDIKPSNILLDACLSAKIADFGLARLQTPVADDLPAVAVAPASNLGDNEVAIEIELNQAVTGDSKSFPNDRKESAVGGGEDDASIMGETAESTTTTTGFEESIGCGGLAINGGGNGVITPEKSPEEDEGFTTASPVETAVGLEVASTSETGGGFDRVSVDSGKDAAASGSRRGGRKKSGPGKDWWWRQDTGGGANSESGGGVKDYVMEWIRSEIKKERPKSDWITASAASAEDCLPKPSGGRSERKKQQRRMEWWVSLDEEKSKKKEKSRPPREWWREEFCEELTNKQKRRAIQKSQSNIEKGEQQWWQKDEGLESPSGRRKRRKKKSWSRSSRTSMDGWMEGISGEIRTTGRRSSQDWASGDIPKSGTVSSTPSMRGTVCYVAPEYGGGGPLSEKCDIYSFGVLLLVLVSGRRPLQVTASPMSEFERANLISWARHLAHLGRLLDLVDPSLRAVDREQVLLCITVALLCLQRSPACRPSTKEIIGMLTGQSEPPNLPLEFSPSPPGGFSFKSRKKARVSVFLQFSYGSKKLLALERKAEEYPYSYPG
ncbi:LOW QUALITY PROTEIN: receptor-like serine/threonine-protein kinase At2g45590 [Elaeis guineensis]|uniref:LOW QUALITY PROTEIN: receptor-like serine/threonine-protein kinase At2g45590 n=1 Tax=Elaeis guineensis var. tenera TaxID=51953 RepID=UPI003C6CC74E